jgi:hypothetical protein
MTLAYVFWHRPFAETSPEDYETRLAAFHAALAATPPPGFSDSCALRLGDGGYEDWYLVADWAALGTLNRHAVTGSRRPPHDAAAARTADGSAGIYAPLTRDPVPPMQGHGAWLAKPPGLGYADFRAALPAGAVAWQRQMTLGPQGEFTLRADAPLDLPWPHAPLTATRVA